MDLRALLPGRRCLKPLVLMCAWLPVTAFAAIDFEPGDLALFTLNGGHATDLSIAATAGIGGGSGLVSAASGVAFPTDSAVFGTGVPFLAGETYTVSMFY